MTAQVSNSALVGASARALRAYGASARQQIDGLDSPSASAGRDQAQRFDDYGDRVEPGNRRRRAEYQDQVVSFGGVLVSHEVGQTIMQAQTLNGLHAPPPIEAERHVASYEFVQSLVGPAEPIVLTSPFQQAQPN